jgi:hypothetical protein
MRWSGTSLFWAMGRRHSTAAFKAIGKGTTKGAKDSKKGRPRWVAVTTSSNDDDKEVDGSNKEYVTATEHDFKR